MIDGDYDMQHSLGPLLTEAERLIESGHMDRAASLYERACIYVPNEPHLHHVLGLVRLSQGALRQAISAFEKAVAINPNEPQWWSNLGAAYLHSGAISKAIRAFQHAISLDGANAAHYVHVGAALKIKGDLELAVNFLHQALTISPHHAEALANLCIIYQETCQWDNLESAQLLLEEATHWALSIGTPPNEHPLFNIRRSSDITLNQAVAQAWSRQAKLRAINTAIPFTHRDGPRA